MAIFAFVSLQYGHFFLVFLWMVFKDGWMDVLRLTLPYNIYNYGEFYKPSTFNSQPTGDLNFHTTCDSRVIVSVG